MKCFLVALVSCLTIGAYAQEPANLMEQSIWQAYGKLQTENSFGASLTGTETSFGVTRKFSSTLYFMTAADPRSGQLTGSKVELDDYDTSGSSPVLVHRYVGDGKTLWSYDILNQRYSATFYSYYGKNPPVNYLGSDAPRMLAQLYSVVTGPSAYMVRMLREINPGSILLSSRYDTWAPGEAPSQPQPFGPVNDPLVSTAYTIDTPPEIIPGRQVLFGGQWVLYGPSTPHPNRSVAFQMDNDGDSNNPDWRLDYIYFVNKTPTTMTDWTLSITDPTITLPAYAFQPYLQNVTQGWLPLSSPKPYSG